MNRQVIARLNVHRVVILVKHTFEVGDFTVNYLYSEGYIFNIEYSYSDCFACS
jgi:hypothetical protein